VRLAPEAFAGRVTAVFVAGCCFAACCLTMGCSRPASDVKVTLKIEPTPPVAGVATIVHVTLQQESGNLVSGAKVYLEAHMKHPGMVPVTSEAIERQNGAYEARLHLSMAGDWVFVVTGELPDGSRVRRDIKVPDVRLAGEPAPTR
jgi:hypothetical protein